MQLNESSRLTQVAPFWQGELRHSLTSVSHVAPVKAEGQVHVKAPGPASAHDPPLRHGVELHAGMASWHVSPEHPGAQVHV